MIGCSSRDGVPGGSSSYGTSEKTTTPTGASESTSDWSVRRTTPDWSSRIESERSRTTTPVVPVGSSPRSRRVELARAQRLRPRAGRSRRRRRARAARACAARRSGTSRCRGVSIAGRLLSPRMCLLQSPPALLFLAQALLLELAQLLLERRAHAAGEALRLVGPGSGRRPGERAGRLARARPPPRARRAPRRRARASGAGRPRRWRARRPRAARAPARAASAAAPARAPAPAPARRGAAASRRRPAPHRAARSRRLPPIRSASSSPGDGAVRRLGHVGDVQPPRLGIGELLGADPRVHGQDRERRPQRAAPAGAVVELDPRRLELEGQRVALGDAGLPQAAQHVRHPDVRARRGIGARHRRRPDAAPRLEADAHPDRCSDRRGAGRLRGRPARARCRRRRRSGRRASPAPGAGRIVGLVGAVVAEKNEGQARSGERDEDERCDRRCAPAGHATPPLRAGRGGTRSSRGRRRARRRARSTRAARDRGRAAVSSSSSASSRSSLARRRAATSFFVRRTCVIRPLRGSRSGTTIPLTSGKLCSQTGSWITTGMTSQRCSTAVSHVSRDGGSRKSEKTKTKLPGGDVAAMLEEVLERALDAVGRRAPAGLVGPLLAQVGEPALAARRQPERLAVRVVEVADEAAGLGGARDDDVGRAPHRRALVEPGQRRREEGELGAAVCDDDDARPLVGVALADDELVGCRARTTSGPRPPSRSCGCRRPAGTAASPPPRCRGRAERSASSRASGRSAGGAEMSWKVWLPLTRGAARRAARETADPRRSPGGARARGTPGGTPRSPRPSRRRAPGRRAQA